MTLAPETGSLQPDLFEQGSSVDGVPLDPPIPRMTWRTIYHGRNYGEYVDTRRIIKITLPKIEGIYRGKPDEIR